MKSNLPIVQNYRKWKKWKYSPMNIALRENAMLATTNFFWFSHVFVIENRNTFQNVHKREISTFYGYRTREKMSVLLQYK